MKFLFLGALLGLIGVTAREASAYQPPRPDRAVEILRYQWRDAKREREVPVKIYLPKDGGEAMPLIVFSHGLGGSREGYEFLGQHWAGCGYVSVHLQHLGSDEAVWKGLPAAERLAAMRKAALIPANSVNRPRDVSFAIDRLTELNADASSPLKGRLDLQRIGMAGHSYGGFTTMAIAGQQFGRAQAADPRVKAAIQMSAPAAPPAQRANAYAKITTPVFHMTGTRDESIVGDTTAAERRIPFDHMHAAETCLLTLQDGDHMVFAGAPRRPGGANEQDAAFQKLICAGSTAYWEAWLEGDAAAKTWLMEGGFAQLVGPAGVFETKKPAK